jgi:hypothetical protein
MGFEHNQRRVDHISHNISFCIMIRTFCSFTFRFNQYFVNLMTVLGEKERQATKDQSKVIIFVLRLLSVILNHGFSGPH